MMKTRNEEVADEIAKSAKRLAKCVPNPLRSAFDSELERYVGLKIEENRLGGRREASGLGRYN